ncbi:MAG TPA: energy transducer TonB [Vicinamibacterales bacterium]|nr:energy transducer TonB [Vicinamibacterales bacterium]
MPDRCTLGLFEYPPVAAGAATHAISADEDVSSDARSLLCLALAAPRLPQRSRSAGRGGALSILFHAAIVTTVIAAAAWSGSGPTPSPTATPSHQPLQLPRMVFLQLPGPGGGGGGGGNRQPKPPSRAQAIGRDRLTIPVAKPVVVSERPKDVTPPPQQVVLDAKPLASGTALLTGLPDASPSLPFSQGPGVGGGVGDGTGSGIGSGIGPGVGPGSGGGFGGGAHRLGSGVVPPTLLQQVKPKYTAEALRQRIQGTVALEVVVSRDGIPLAIRVTRSLDPGGLDQEAIAAAREWRFTPGRIGDVPVDVLVTILLDFSVR